MERASARESRVQFLLVSDTERMIWSDKYGYTTRYTQWERRIEVFGVLTIFPLYSRLFFFFFFFFEV